jgi:hypothetical protein
VRMNKPVRTQKSLEKIAATLESGEPWKELTIAVSVRHGDVEMSKIDRSLFDMAMLADDVELALFLLTTALM